jgi:hypothetical protein
MSSLETAPIARPRLMLPQEALASLRENSPIILVCCLFALSPFVVAGIFDIPARPYTNLVNAYLMLAAYFAVCLGFAALAWWLYRLRAGAAATPPFRLRERMLLAAPVLAFWPVTISSFSYLKSALPLVQPFYLDPLLDRWDRVLHFGFRPWELLAPIMHHMPVTLLISIGYLLWFLVIQMVLTAQCMSLRDRRLRLQFILSELLAWTLIGNLAAALLSSAGPCFYGLVIGGPDPYAPLFAYLHEAAAAMKFNLSGEVVELPLTSLQIQEMLWQSYQDGDFGFARGISAAPSMHIASTWIVTRFCFAAGRRAAILGSLFLLVIFLGSIHLGWHYAVDGYIAVLLAWLIWRFVDWMLGRPAVQRFLWPAETLPIGR